MDNVIIACQTLRDELNLAMQQTGVFYPVIWVDAEYHNDPDQLRAKLQQEIDYQSGAHNILFAYGCCGSGLVGLRATSANLIIPKTEDCISMVLTRPGEEFVRPKQTYFLTNGWTEGSKSIFAEYEHALKRYGEARTRRLFDVMLKHYRYFMLIDTGAYSVDECLNKVRELAQKTGLQTVVAEGGIWFLEKLLTGPYEQDFCVIPKGGTVDMSHFGMAQHITALQSLQGGI